ncbi:MAG: YqgE/AlgH family protein [Thermoguttaceae bacterium]
MSSEPTFNQMNYSGQLLVASPSLLDANFHQTVVLMIDGDDDGAIGVVLNRVAEKTVRDMWRDVFHRDVAAQHFIRLGGPVFGPIIAVHSEPSLGEREVGRGVFVSLDRDNLDALVVEPPDAFHLFIGHAGWGEGQLRNEIKEGSWFCLEASRETIFGDETKLWQHSLNNAGNAIMSSMLHRPLTTDPSCN